MGVMRHQRTALGTVVLAFLGISCGSGAVAPGGSGGAGMNGGTGHAGSGATAGSGGATGNGGAGHPGFTGNGGTPVVITDPAARAQALAALRADIASDRPADAAAFQSRWPTHYRTSLPYDPLQAQGIDKLTASRLGVSDAERQAIARDGFVISGRQAFPTFFYGYKAIYADHLPLYVSVDSVMYAVHRSYDAALMSLEYGFLAPTLKKLLSDVHSALASGVGSDLSADVRADVDLYLTVARQLLGDTASPVAGASASDVSQLVAAAKAAQGVQPVMLFGEVRYVDFSQFTPRGHYADGGTLQAYFRAMIWLGRTDLRLLTYDTSAPPDAPPHFQRRQFLASLLLAELTGDQQIGAWRQVDDILRAFVGESDNMTVADFARLTTTAGAATAAALAALSDQAIAQALLDGGFGVQRIASQILLVPPEGGGVPLDRVFLFFGQRFVIDSEVFSDVVFDRVRGEPKRLMPNPLDVAFAALGNNAAAPLLATELATYPNYPGALHDARRLVDLHGADFWGESLYTSWLGVLRGLSPPAGDPTTAPGLPAVMQTERWARRVLNAQLGSWAELRHDTLLYAKQSYTGGFTCDFPDAYVDPYPDAWAGIVRLAQLGQMIGTALPANSGFSNIGPYFAKVESIASTLGAMAQAERNGQPLTDAQLAFINQAVDEVKMQVGCTTALVPTGWYPMLFLNGTDPQTQDPTIADVHTDPNTAQVLHVATGFPRLAYVTVDGCNGPRAYAGIVSAYFEKKTDGFQRLTDQEWTAAIMQTPPADVGWMADIVAR
jgi:hypothetical protein